ncbi:MAG: carbohydrate ABC transporter permease [Spirochaetales bacterium]
MSERVSNALTAKKTVRGRGPRDALLLPYLLIAPALAFILTFTVWPTIRAVWQSLHRQRLNIAHMRDPEFIGLQNYAQLLGDAEFLSVLQNTAIYVGVTVPVSVFLGLMFAQMLTRERPGIGFFRLAIFYPAVLPMVSIATIWLFLYSPLYGLFMQAIRSVGFPGPNHWTSSPQFALPAVILVFLFKQSGFYMIFYLAGLQSIPGHLYEAARLEGAGPLRILLSITLPLLRRTTVFVTTIAVIGSFQMIDHIFVLTEGGPSNASRVMLYYIWQQRFSYMNVGKAQTLTVVLIVMLLAFTISNVVISERRAVDYE